MERRLWVGPAGTVSHFHKDNHFSFARVQSLFAQVVGEKRFVLVSPEHDEFMYPAPNQNTLQENYAYQGLVDCDAPDYEKYPLYRRAVLLEAIVRGGEMLYIPAGYWHYVRGLSPCISVSHWWDETRIVDVVRRFMDADDAPAFLQANAGTLTTDDVTAFRGGVSALVDALDLFPAEGVAFVLMLFDDRAREMIGREREARGSSAPAAS